MNVASRAHYRARAIDWDALRSPARSTAGLDEYSVSKLANVLFTKSLAKRLAGTGVTAYALHPGVVATDIWRELPWGLRHLAKAFMISPEKGARTTLHCVASPEVEGEPGSTTTLARCGGRAGRRTTRSSRRSCGGGARRGFLQRRPRSRRRDVFSPHRDAPVAVQP